MDRHLSQEQAIAPGARLGGSEIFRFAGHGPGWSNSLLRRCIKHNPTGSLAFLRSPSLLQEGPSRKAHDQCLQALPGSTPGSGTTRTTPIRALTSQCSSYGRASVSKLNVAGSIPVIATQSSIFTRSFSLSFTRFVAHINQRGHSTGWLPRL